MFDAEALRAFIAGSGLQPTETAGSWVFTCPRCGRAKKLWIRKSDGYYQCFRCATDESYGDRGFRGKRVEYALAELLGVPAARVREQLYGASEQQAERFLDVKILDPYQPPQPIAREPLPAENSPRFGGKSTDVQPLSDPGAARGLAYLRGRGIPGWLAEEYGVRYLPVMRRVAVPVVVGGVTVGWQARLVVPEKWTARNGEEREIPKILTSDGLSGRRGGVLMFQDRLRGSDHAVVCEGPFDGLKAHYCGGNVVTMGKVVSAGQIAILRRSGVKRIYLALDPDAQDATGHLVRELYGDAELYQMLPDGRDLGAMDFGEVLELFFRARRVDPSRVFVFISRLR